jgi:hypothetical protein
MAESTPVKEKGPTELEANLIEQDHRFIHVVLAWLGRKKWAKEDPRRTAAVKALVWQVFSPSGAAAGGSLLATLTLAAFVYQNSLLLEQTQIGQQQMQIAQEQNEVFKTSLESVINPKTAYELEVMPSETVEGKVSLKIIIANTGDRPVAIVQRATLVTGSRPDLRMVKSLSDENVVISAKGIAILDFKFNRGDAIDSVEIGSDGKGKTTSGEIWLNVLATGVHHKKQVKLPVILRLSPFSIQAK